MLTITHLDHFVIVVCDFVLPLEPFYEVFQPIAHPLIVGSLERVKDGSPHQQVGEGDNDQG